MQGGRQFLLKFSSEFSVNRDHWATFLDLHLQREWKSGDAYADLGPLDLPLAVICHTLNTQDIPTNFIMLGWLSHYVGAQPANLQLNSNQFLELQVFQHQIYQVNCHGTRIPANQIARNPKWRLTAQRIAWLWCHLRVIWSVVFNLSGYTCLYIYVLEHVPKDGIGSI